MCGGAARDENGDARRDGVGEASAADGRDAVEGTVERPLCDASYPAVDDGDARPDADLFGRYPHDYCAAVCPTLDAGWTCGPTNEGGVRCFRWCL